MSPSAHENTDVKGDRRALVLWERTEQPERSSRCENMPFFSNLVCLVVCLYVLPHFLSPGHCHGIVQGLSARFKYTMECETDFYCP